MKITCQVDTRAFRRSCTELARASGKSVAEVVEYETSKVLESAVRLTPMASIAKVRANRDGAPFTAQPDTLYTPRTAAGRRVRAKAKRTAKQGLLIYHLDNRYPDALWRAIKRRRAESLKRAILAVGAAKRSWVELARLLGYEIKAPARAKRAVPVVSSNFRFRRVKPQTGVIRLFFSNAQPTINVPTVGGNRILQRALNGRVKYFETSLRRGVFKDMEKVAKRYPGLRAS